MSQEKSISDLYVLADVSRILNRQSKYTDSITIGDTDIRINGKPIIEYILNGLLNTEDVADPDQRDTSGHIIDYDSIIGRYFEFRQNMEENVSVSMIANSTFTRDDVMFTRGYTIKMDDRNDILATSYPSLISSKLKTVTYANNLDLYYDIFRASETLKVMFINMPMILVQQIPVMCHSYLDIIAIPTIEPFKSFCDLNQSVCNIRVIDKDVFRQVGDTPEFAWIRDEIEHPDIFNQVFKSIVDKRRTIQEQERKIGTLLQYMMILAKQDPENLDLYIGQITNGLQRPYGDEDLKMADEVVRFVQLGLIKGVAIPEEENVTTLDANIDPSIIGGRTMTIRRFVDEIAEPAFKIFALDYPLKQSAWRDMGTFAIYNMITRVLDLSTDDANQIIHDSRSYAELLETYYSIRKSANRNKLAKNAMASITTWLNTDKGAFERYAGKRIIFNAKVKFLSDDANFIGKCIEDMIENREEIETPVYRPMSPVGPPPTFEIPPSQVHDPTNPFGFKISSNTTIPFQFSEWVTSQYESVVKVARIVANIPTITEFLDFFQVFYTKFMTDNDKVRSVLHKYLDQYKFNTHMGEFITGTFYSAIEESMMLFNRKEDVALFDNIVSDGAKELYTALSESKKGEIATRLSKYISASLFVDINEANEVASAMIGSPPQSVNRLNFWNYTMESFKNPTNPNTLQLAIRKAVLFPNDDQRLPPVAQIQVLLNSYPGDKKIALFFLMQGLPDITHRFIATYVLQNKEFASDENLSRLAQYYNSDTLYVDTLSKLDGNSDGLAAIKIMRQFGKYDFAQQLATHEALLREKIGQKGIDAINYFITHYHSN
jgi:hypothetical protein